MSPQQVRWKMNALTKRYKECVDSNNKTGRGTTQFQWFDQLDEILGKNKNITEPAYVISSKLCSVSNFKNKENYLTNEQSEDKRKKKKELRESHKIKNIENKILEEPSNIANKQNTEDVIVQAETSKKIGNEKCLKRGTGSNLAKKKFEIGQQWQQHLEDKAKKEIIKEKRYEDMIKKKEELVELKKKQIELKEKELQQKKAIANSKVKDKEKRHIEILNLEREKCKLLRAYLKKDAGNTSQKNYSESSDSSD
jgi:hypothetical protein